MRGKDQSYVLWGVERRVLSRLSFPVGEYQKGEIRQMAAELGLDVADKPDSQEICFVPDRTTPASSANTAAPRHRGRDRHHRRRGGRAAQGLEQFTIGQRKGLGIAFGEPRYVVRLEPATRRVVVGTKQELARGELTASGANWLASPPHRCEVKIRYRSGAVAASVDLLPGDRFAIHFDEPCWVLHRARRRFATRATASWAAAGLTALDNICDLLLQ